MFCLQSTACKHTEHQSMLQVVVCLLFLQQQLLLLCCTGAVSSPHPQKCRDGCQLWRDPLQVWPTRGFCRPCQSPSRCYSQRSSRRHSRHRWQQQRTQAAVPGAGTVKGLSGADAQVLPGVWEAFECACADECAAGGGYGRRRTVQGTERRCASPAHSLSRLLVKPKRHEGCQKTCLCRFEQSVYQLRSCFAAFISWC